MKKVGSFILNSIILFWGYFLSSSLFLLVMQTFMRMIIDADSKGEYLWKTLVMYFFMLAINIGYLSVTASTHKTKFLNFTAEKEWTLTQTVTYIAKSTDFWLCSIGFAVWPIMLPRLFGAINRLYVSPEFYQSFPLSILSVVTVSLPGILLCFAGWVLVLSHWYSRRESN